MPSGQNVAKAMAFVVVVGGNVFGMAPPIVTGHVVATTGGYDRAFAIAGILLVLGAVIALTMTRRPVTSPISVPTGDSHETKNPLERSRPRSRYAGLS